jgi:hypothetical protein
LEWALRRVPGDSLFERLENYLDEINPRRAIEELIVASEPRLRTAIGSFRYGNLQLPRTEEEEHLLIDRILWKLGFNVHVFPGMHRVFWDRLDSFLAASRVSDDYTEKEREHIRAAAANFFVSLEEVLDYALSFSAWALLSDHFGATRFQFGLEAARAILAQKLTGRKTPGGVTLRYDAAGINTLFPLLSGFDALSEVAKEILSGDESPYVRQTDQVPGAFRFVTTC